jgi:hypothetical protein
MASRNPETELSVGVALVGQWTDETESGRVLSPLVSGQTVLKWLGGCRTSTGGKGARKGSRQGCRPKPGRLVMQQFWGLGYRLIEHQYRLGRSYALWNAKRLASLGRPSSQL